ncbi:MAG: hypothetical protein ACW985_13690, partial [Candidatus Thorarchaeota archaeon]
MANPKRRRLTTLCVITFFVVMIGLTPGMAQAYDNPDYTIPEIQGDGWSNTVSGYIDTWGVVTADYQD